MNKKKIRRRQLLERQADSLAQFVRGTSDRHILCPLCLQLLPEESWRHLSVEDAPPRQYAGGEQRCLTCASGNNQAGGAYETRVAMRNDERADRVARATALVARSSGLVTARTPLYSPLSIAWDLAGPSADEFQLELKSAYLIAFATLGHRYILDPGLDQVRDLIDPDAGKAALSRVRPCAKLSGMPLASGLIVTHEPLPCVIVPHPSGHHSDDSGHVVFLPVPGAEEGFYRRISLLDRVKLTISNAEVYERPMARRLPMHWDHGDHPMRTRTVWQSHPDDEPDSPVLTIDLR